MRVGVPEVVRENHERLADHEIQSSGPEQAGLLQDTVSENTVNVSGQRIPRVVAPVGAGACQPTAKTVDRTRSGVVNRALERGADLIMPGACSWARNLVIASTSGSRPHSSSSCCFIDVLYDEPG